MEYLKENAITSINNVDFETFMSKLNSYIKKHGDIVNAILYLKNLKVPAHFKSGKKLLLKMLRTVYYSRVVK